MDEKRARRGRARLDRRLRRPHIRSSSFPGPVPLFSIAGPLSSAVGSLFTSGPHVTFFVQHLAAVPSNVVRPLLRTFVRACVAPAHERLEFILVVMYTYLVSN